MPQQRLVSPNDMFAAAKKMMLEGREPSSTSDWQIVFNFFAANIADAELEACKILRLLYNAPLSDSQLREIVEFQVIRKPRKS